MWKFLRYEIKRSGKFILAFSFLSILITILFAVFMVAISSKTRNSTSFESSFNIAFIFLIFVMLVVNLLYFLQRYRKDIFSKSAYLTFTLDISTGGLFFAKLLSAVFITIINQSIFTIFFSIMNAIVNFKYGIENIIHSMGIANFLQIYLWAMLIMSLYWLMAYTMLTVAISLTKVKFFRKYYDFVSIVLFVVILTIIVSLIRYFYIALPYVFEAKSFSMKFLNNINGFDISMLYFNIDSSVIGINLVDLILSLFVIITSFVSNLLIVENKIDL